ncbi:Mule transposase protein, partial [Fusarium oxysporum f. sp. albedinis]
PVAGRSSLYYPFQVQSEGHREYPRTQRLREGSVTQGKKQGPLVGQIESQRHVKKPAWLGRSKYLNDGTAFVVLGICMFIKAAAGLISCSICHFRNMQGCSLGAGSCLVPVNWVQMEGFNPREATLIGYLIINNLDMACITSLQSRSLVA